ncbi:hypothetical protein BVX97_04015 [bacterium E08(2017)]|nr:hypothetical protein BVX97_04015 [bacterium E08(2017)]
MNKKYLGFRAVVWVVAVYHVLLGITLSCPVPVIEVVTKGVLGATKMPDASSLFLARMAGAYLLVFGIGIGLAAYDPIKNRALLSLGAIVVVLRVLQRAFQLGDLQMALGISTGTNWITVGVMMSLAIVLLVFRFKLLSDMKKEKME